MVIRVTERVRFDSPGFRIANLRRRQMDANQQISSGRRINKPSDDPLGALKVSTYQTQLERAEQHERNIDAVRHLVNVADGVLAESANTLYRVKELTIQSLSSALTPADRGFIADEIAQMTDHLRSLANTRTNNRYIFSGFRTDTEPYDAAYAYQGDDNATRLEVGEFQFIQATQPGTVVFGDGNPGNVDVFQNLVNLEANIRAGDEPLTQDELEILETSIEQVIIARSNVGVQMNRLEAAESVNAYMQERLPEALSIQRDTDFPEAIAELTLVDNALQATLAASSRLMSSTSLLDFLR